MEDPIVFGIMMGLSVGIGAGLTAWFRKKGYVRQPTGKLGWGLTKDDFKIHHFGALMVILLVLSGIFYLTYLWAVQAA